MPFADGWEVASASFLNRCDACRISNKNVATDPIRRGSENEVTRGSLHREPHKKKNLLIETAIIACMTSCWSWVDWLLLLSNDYSRIWQLHIETRDTGKNGSPHGEPSTAIWLVVFRTVTVPTVQFQHSAKPQREPCRSKSRERGATLFRSRTLAARRLG